MAVTVIEKAMKNGRTLVTVHGTIAEVQAELGAGTGTSAGLDYEGRCTSPPPRDSGDGVNLCTVYEVPTA